MEALCGRNITSRDVIINFVKHRLRETGYDGSRAGDAIRYLYAQSPYEDSAVVLEIVAVAKNLDSDIDHRSFMVKAVATVDLYGINAQQNYNYTMNQMFTDGRISWGRLFMIIIYMGELVLQAVRHGQHPRAVQVIDWCTNFLNQPSFMQWINDNGGWEAAPNSEQLIEHRAAYSTSSRPRHSTVQIDECRENEGTTARETRQIEVKNQYVEEMTLFEKAVLTSLSIGTVVAAGISVLSKN